jgi:hypothetical protein
MLPYLRSRNHLGTQDLLGTIRNTINLVSRFCVFRAGPGGPIASDVIETVSRLHALFHQNFDFGGGRGVDGNLGSGVFDSDDQAERDGL